MQGFNAINESELAGAKESGLTYYQVRLVLIVFNHSSQYFYARMQVWNSSEWQLNDGPQGLQRLDNVISEAEKHDIKVIVAFTNNW